MSRSRRRARASFSDDSSFGERRNHRRPDGVAERLEPLVGRVVGAAQVRRHVLHHAAAAEALERGRGVRRARRVALSFADDGVGELPGLVEVADADEIVRVGRRGLGDVAPARGFRLDAQEIEQQLVIERAQAASLTVASQPAMRSGGSSLARSTSTARVRAPDSSRAYCSETYFSSE